MKNTGKLFANYAIFMAIILALTGLQSSLWLQLFGWFPAPQIWLAIIVFWVLYREFWETIIMAYIASVIGTAFTALSFTHLLMNCLLTCAVLAIARKRVYWAGATFFMLATGAAVIVFFFSSLLIAWLYDATPIRHPPFFSWLITWLLTMLISIPLHRLLAMVDRVTEKEHPTDAGTGVL